MRHVPILALVTLLCACDSDTPGTVLAPDAALRAQFQAQAQDWDVSVRGHVNGEFSSSFYSGRQGWTVSARGVDGVWGAAHGTMAWTADSPVPGFPVERLVADVTCIRLQQGTLSDGRHRLRLLVMGIPRGRDATADVPVVGLQYSEFDGQPIFTAVPQFVLKPGTCSVTGRSFGEAVVTSGRFVFETR
ncbi:MAG: hypothetical protein WEB88_12805 [Gemmatimonadota bacterium]